VSNIDKSALKPGTYAILFRDNWDGEEDVYETLATLSDDLVWYHHENGRALIEYEGDEVLKVWPLDDGSNVLALRAELEESERLRLKFQEANCELCQKLEAAEKKTVEMPNFYGYVPHVARELQAAFRIACDNAGINVAAAGKGETS